MNRASSGVFNSRVVRIESAETGERKMKIVRWAVLASVVLGTMGVLYAVGPDWPTDRFKAFAEAKKKKKLLFLYYTSTS